MKKLISFFRTLENLSSEEIRQASTKLISVYKDNLDEFLEIELIQFASFSQMFKDEKSNNISREQFLYTSIVDKHVEDAFENLEIALRIYLALMITNCSSERFFSKINIINNILRTSMLNERLNNLALLSTESDILRELVFDDLIDNFASGKARKVSSEIVFNQMWHLTMLSSLIG